MEVYQPVSPIMSRSGIAVSADQQRQALESQGVTVTRDPADEFDILHANLGPLPDPVTLGRIKMARRSGIPVVMHTHVTPRDFQNSFRLSNMVSWPLRHYLRYAYSHADMLVSPSDYAKSVVEAMGFDNTRVVSNGIDTDRLAGYEDRRADARMAFGMGGTTVFTVGTVFKRKGLPAFVHTAAAMPETEFYWFGKQFPRPVLQHGTTALIEGSPDNARFVGFVEDIRDAYAAGDIFLFPTREENQGIAALEAAYCRCPLVLRDIPVFEEYFEHGHNCLKADSVDGFAAAIRRLKQDGELRRRLVKNARVTAEEHTLDRVGEQLCAVYREALAQN